MECKQCGSSRELYVFKDCCDCECLCKRCLMQSCDVEEVEVKRYVDVNSGDVFYNNDDLAEYVVDAGLVEIESEETTAFYDSDTAEYLEDDEDRDRKTTLTHFEGALRALLKGKAVRRTDWIPGVYAISKFGTLEDHQGSRVELRIGFDLDIEENIGVFKATLTKLKVFNRLK